MRIQGFETTVWSDDLDEAAATIEEAVQLAGDRIVDQDVSALLQRAKAAIDLMVVYVPNNEDCSFILKAYKQRRKELTQ
jgi:hypothetical protein